MHSHSSLVIRFSVEVPDLAGGEVSGVGVVQGVGVTIDIVLEPGQPHVDALLVASLAAGGGHNNPLEQHRSRLRRALVARRVAVRAGGGAVGDLGVSLLVIVLASWKIIRIVT